MTIRRAVLASMAVIFAILLSAYLYSRDMFRAFSGAKLSAGECSDAASATVSTNPNKMLFISCGGFLD